MASKENSTAKKSSAKKTSTAKVTKKVSAKKSSAKKSVNESIVTRPDANVSEAKKLEVTKSEGKNVPTPTRKEAEARNKVNSLAPATTKSEKAAARNIDRQRRLEMRAAYMRGDESVLPARDKGPVRKFVRDYVDSRRMPGEYIFYMLFAAIILSFVARLAIIQLIVLVIMYVAVIVLIAHAAILRRQIVKAVKDKFPNEPTKGLGMYAFMRSTQIRRLRAPSPQVSPSKSFFAKK